MVYKEGKGGFRSGNTIRSNPLKRGSWRKERNDARIVRRHFTKSRTELCRDFVDVGAFGEDSSMPDGVEFSLNKQRRWELPGVIENIVHQADSDDDCGVQMIVKTDERRSQHYSRCLQLCASDGLYGDPNVRVKNKSRGFLTAGAELRAWETKGSRKQTWKKCTRKNKGEAINTKSMEQRVQIQYIVTVPADKTSYTFRDKDFRWHQTDWQSPRASRCHRRNFMKQDMSDYEPDLYNENDATFDAYDIDETLETRNDDDVTLADDTWDGYNGAGNFKEPAMVDKTKVAVILESAAISSQKLHHVFRRCYTECRCIPRKFIIDITHRLEIATEIGPLYDKVLLVFEHDTAHVVNTDSHQVFTVSLKSPFGESIMTLFEYMDTDINEIIERVVFGLESLLQPSAPLDTETGHSLTIVEHSLDLLTTAYYPNNARVINYLLTGAIEDAVGDVDSETSDDFELVDNEQGLQDVPTPTDCPICFSASDSCSVISLFPCGHRFCNGCFTAHVQSIVSEGSGVVKCPEFGCKTDVDPGTVTTVLSYHELIKFAKVYHSKSVTRAVGALWCPGTDCGRVLTVNKPDSDIAHCPCGVMTCCKCSQPSHWPADCDAASTHERRLVEQGDKEFLKTVEYAVFTVNVKNCPGCGAMVEKYGGCNQVTCWCGVCFCWGCGNPFQNRYATQDYIHTRDCARYGENDRYGTTRRLFTSFDLHTIGHREKWYKKALEHRLNVHPSKLSLMERAMRLLVKSLRTSLRKSQTNRQTRFQIVAERGHVSLDTGNVVAFFDSLMALYLEVNRVAENVCIILSTWAVVAGDENQLQTGLKQLTNVSQFIWDLFDGDLNCAQPIPYIIQRCNIAVEHGHSSMKLLINCIQQLESSESMQ